MAQKVEKFDSLKEATPVMSALQKALGGKAEVKSHSARVTLVHPQYNRNLVAMFARKGGIHVLCPLLSTLGRKPEKDHNGTEREIWPNGEAVDKAKTLGEELAEYLKANPSPRKAKAATSKQAKGSVPPKAAKAKKVASKKTKKVRVRRTKTAKPSVSGSATTS